MSVQRRYKLKSVSLSTSNFSKWHIFKKKISTIRDIHNVDTRRYISYVHHINLYKKYSLYAIIFNNYYQKTVSDIDIVTEIADIRYFNVRNLVKQL